MKNILLIHGWDYENYYGHINHSAWDNRSKFINELAIDNKVYYMDLPGFGLRKEPYAKVWTLDDYAKFINNYIKINNLNIDYILGYSFGGAVALQYKKNYTMHIKEILVSPALVRNEVKSSTEKSLSIQSLIMIFSQSRLHLCMIHIFYMRVSF